MLPGQNEKRVSRRQAIGGLAATSIALNLSGTAWPGTALFAGEASQNSDDKYPTAKDTFGLLEQGKKIPVVYDTDIGGDIDDTWALAMLLGCPELDVKMVLADAGNTRYRAKLLAKFLEVAGRTDIPVAIGLDPADRGGYQAKWLDGYELKKYPGQVHENGVDAFVKLINDSADPVSVISVGAVPNIAEALKRDPKIVRNSRFVGMYGSVKRGYGNSTEIVAEANVRSDPKALQTVFAAPWDITITPLDTCGIVELKGEKYQSVYKSKKPTVKALMENYRIWLPLPPWLTDRPDPSKRSTTLFDTVAVYLAFSESLVNMEEIGLRVTDDGKTLIDSKARKIRCAMSWKDLPAFENLLVDRLVK